MKLRDRVRHKGTGLPFSPGQSQIHSLLAMLSSEEQSV